MRIAYNEANSEVENAFQPIFDLLEDAKRSIIGRNEETYRTARQKTSEMLEYLRHVYSEVKEEGDGFNLYECGTSSEELPPTRLPEEAVEGIMNKLEKIVANH